MKSFAERRQIVKRMHQLREEEKEREEFEKHRKEIELEDGWGGDMLTYDKT